VEFILKTDEENYKQCSHAMPVSAGSDGYEGKPPSAAKPGPANLCRPQRYCCGPIVSSQVAIVVMLARTTASAYEQK
jgi:hypothetical protein